MNFEPGDRTLLWEFGYWAGALRRWYQEGLPERYGIRGDLVSGASLAGEGMPSAEVLDAELKKLFSTKDTRDLDVHECLELDPGLIMLPINTSFCQAFTPMVLEDRDEARIEIDGFGVTKQVRKSADSISRFISWPVEGRKDFEQLKERLQPGLSSRVPDNWKEMVSRYHKRDFPLVAGFCGEGFFGNLRRLMGEMRLFTCYYDDPGLIKHMNDYFSNLWIGLWDEAFRSVKPDCVWFFEDMCYRNGPLISPSLFREFMLPYYQKVNSFLDDQGVEVRIVDTDGNCWELLPLFIEAGITALSPFEVGAGMDIVKVREMFPQFGILGGIDKRSLAIGREAIDAELDYKLPKMLKKGGYIPHADHLVPPNVSWENFKYYRDRVRTYVCK